METEPRFLQPIFYDPQEDWRPHPGSGSEETERIRSSSALQNGVPEHDMQADIEKGLYYFYRPSGCLPTYFDPPEMQEIPQVLMEWEDVPVQSPTFWPIPHPVDLHKDSTPGYQLVETARYEDRRLLGRYTNYRQDQGNLLTEHQICSEKTTKPGIPSEGIEILPHSQTDNQTLGYGDKLQGHVSEGPKGQGQRLKGRRIEAYLQRPNNSESHGFIHWEGSSNVSSFTTRASNAQTFVRVEELYTEQNEIMDSVCNSHSTSPPEFDLVERPAIEIEWSIVPSRKSRAGNFYRCQRYSLGDRCGIPILLGFVASIIGLSLHQRQSIVGCIICTPTPKCCWSLCVDLFRQYHKVGIREEVWRYHFSKITQNFRRHMGSLPENQHPPPDDVCAYITESSGCSQQID
ncbi:hypothetical protein AYI69_g10913 [Smittium culicis]|uniref:Uncharacterized protein n=1 Tax=Smittium culicis TaxID=133412 RepID=A0A1R1X2H5_9FUNG|nr:hypothetical protein AYI69_g10913 [Smittium culicis]